jgi:hypothetical protein
MDGRWWIIRGWAETDRLSHELLERLLTRADVNYELSIDQQGGIRGPDRGRLLFHWHPVV